MNSIFKYILYFFIVINSFIGLSQDAHFSQFYASSLYLNPSLVGVENDVTFKSNYRTQWRQITIPYTTSQVSVILPIMTHSGKAFSDKHKGGFGVSFYNDKAGDGNFKTLGIMLSGAYTLHLGQQIGHNMIILGLQGGIIQKQLDFTNLEWGNQYNPYLGFDPTFNPGEMMVMPTTTNADFNFGMTWFLNSAKNYSVKKISAYSGFAAYHLNRPDESIMMNNASRLPLLLKYHGGFEYHINHRINISPNLLFMLQAQNYQVNIGTYLTYDAAERRQSGLLTHINLILGAWSRLKDSFILLAGVENHHYTLGFSYDLNSTQIRTSSRGSAILGDVPGAFEISLAIRKIKERRQLKFSTPRI